MHPIVAEVKQVDFRGWLKQKDTLGHVRTLFYTVDIAATEDEATYSRDYGQRYDIVSTPSEM